MSKFLLQYSTKYVFICFTIKTSNYNSHFLQTKILCFIVKSFLTIDEYLMKSDYHENNFLPWEI